MITMTIKTHDIKEKGGMRRSKKESKEKLWNINKYIRYCKTMTWMQDYLKIFWLCCMTGNYAIY